MIVRPNLIHKSFFASVIMGIVRYMDKSTRLAQIGTKSGEYRP